MMRVLAEERSGLSVAQREFDIILYGASGFTGRLVAEHLHARTEAGADIAWAVAGRNEAKLKTILEQLGIDTEAVPILVADGNDEPALKAMAERARTVLTTVGPYARYGSSLVAACAALGTHYCDLSGEVQWMRKMINRHLDDASASGARIVHACGFDSIPSDIGTWYLQQEALRRFGRPCSEVSLLVKAMKGGFSGGTATSLLNAVEEGRRDRQVAKTLIDPYSLNPEGERRGPDGRDQMDARYHHGLETWTAPFVMGIVNMRVVRRSNALLNYAYGRDFRYNEATNTGPGIAGRMRATAVSAGFRTFMLASAIDVTRNHVVKRLLPDPGEGPDESARESGYFNMLLFGTTANNDVLQVRVTGDRDPGYGSTSRMIGESALCLAQDDLPVAGRVLDTGVGNGRAAISAPARACGTDVRRRDAVRRRAETI